MTMKRTAPFLFAMTASVVLLSLAGILGWLLFEVGADAQRSVPVGGVSSWVSLAGIAAVLVGAVLVTLSGRRAIAMASDPVTRSVQRSGTQRDAFALRSPGGLEEPRLADAVPPIVRRLQGEVARAERYGHELSVVSVSVDGPSDGSERIPETLSARVLLTVGEIVRNSTRVSDAYGPAGSGELILLLTETDAKGAARVAEKLRRNVEVYPFDRPTPVTISIGVTGYSGTDRPDVLVARAVRARESARAKGGNQVVIAPAAG